MTKINRDVISLDRMITLQIARPQVSVSDLIQIVNYAYESAIIDYWEVDVISTKKAKLTIGSIEHPYTYAFCNCGSWSQCRFPGGLVELDRAE